MNNLADPPADSRVSPIVTLEDALRDHPQAINDVRAAELVAVAQEALRRIAVCLDRLADVVDPAAQAVGGLPWTLMDAAQQCRGVARQLDPRSDRPET